MGKRPHQPENTRKQPAPAPPGRHTGGTDPPNHAKTRREPGTAPRTGRDRRGRTGTATRPPPPTADRGFLSPPKREESPAPRRSHPAGDLNLPGRKSQLDDGFPAPERHRPHRPTAPPPGPPATRTGRPHRARQKPRHRRRTHRRTAGPPPPGHHRRPHPPRTRHRARPTPPPTPRRFRPRPIGPADHRGRTL